MFRSQDPREQMRERFGSVLECHIPDREGGDWKSTAAVLFP